MNNSSPAPKPFSSTTSVKNDCETVDRTTLMANKVNYDCTVKSYFKICVVIRNWRLWPERETTDSMENMKAPWKWSQKVSTAPWEHGAVQVINPTLSILSHWRGAHVKSENTRDKAFYNMFFFIQHSSVWISPVLTNRIKWGKMS